MNPQESPAVAWRAAHSWVRETTAAQPASHGNTFADLHLVQHPRTALRPRPGEPGWYEAWQDLSAWDEPACSSQRSTIPRSPAVRMISPLVATATVSAARPLSPGQRHCGWSKPRVPHGRAYAVARPGLTVPRSRR